MTIPKKYTDAWGLLYSHGDALKLSDISGYHPETIRRALRDRRCSDELFVIMKEYFDNKKNMIEDDE